ncbi:TBC domain-containing protein kinase-like protein [Operophtera brumata]|uniref:TBC domain-containing protein kinase-like protein n=1 Tax=Operophtera brumata TaxID=104452 RepID=A0A0L7LCL6_OPEBR|nr:TBC domain-containing protein kinase-like protein [Operophtera brumata]
MYAENEEDYKFAACTYFAKNHPGETCGSNGLPLTPSSITILGRAQRLLTLEHDNLCTYLDVIRGKHERIIVVAEVIGKPLSEWKYKFSNEEITNIACQVACGMKFLHNQDITHRTLSDDNILLDTNGRVKMFNYGILPRYFSPETILGGGGPAADVWAFGILLLELCIGKLWQNLKPGPILRRILTLVHANNPAERIAREHDCFDSYKVSSSEKSPFSDIVAELSKIDRKQLVEVKKPRGLMGLKLQFLLGLLKARLSHVTPYHFCPLIHERKKDYDAIALPKIIRERDTEYQRTLTQLSSYAPRQRWTYRRYSEGTSGQLYSDLGLLKARLSHVTPYHFCPLIHERKKDYDAIALPKIIRERDTEYQFNRLIWFQRLLRAYPHTAQFVRAEAEMDIPPLLRGDVWAALLGYCWLLCGAAGHRTLKRLLKAWLLTNPQYVYWQGLDSLTAPFFAIIKEYLAKFWQMCAFHEPALATHLHEINFVPELFAIPWFLTMFSHVFPLHKILHIWDALLVEGPSLPLFMGVGILRQLRDTLMESGFNECILLFSDLPEIDIGECVKQSIEMCRSSPKSISYRRFTNETPTKDPMEMVEIPLETLFTEISPRISILDFFTLICEDKCCCIDIRSNLLFEKSCIEGSINVPYSGVQLGHRDLRALGLQPHRTLRDAVRQRRTVVVAAAEDETAQLRRAARAPRAARARPAAAQDAARRRQAEEDGRRRRGRGRDRSAGAYINVPYSGVQLGHRELRALGLQPHRTLRDAVRQRRTVVVAAAEDETAQLFSDYLVQCNVPRVCILHGGTAALSAHLPSLYVTPPKRSGHK